MGLPKSRVDEMLALVALDDTEANRRVRNYSLGMRQRLGIAHALLGDPSVLILDEPANGLDPAGIRWMRILLKGYADRGGTVLLSSHLLNEVEQIADEMLLIGRGKIVARGTKAELLAGAGGVGSLVVAEDNDRLVAALSEKGIAHGPVGLGYRVEAVPVEMDGTGERVEVGHPGLLAGLASGRGPQRGVGRLEVAPELEPAAGPAVVGEEDPLAVGGQDEAGRGEVGGWPGLRYPVRVGGQVYGSGSGRSKKEAEQQAAEEAWNRIRANVESALGEVEGLLDPQVDGHSSAAAAD